MRYFVYALTDPKTDAVSTLELPRIQMNGTNNTSGYRDRMVFMPKSCNKTLHFRTNAAIILCLAFPF